LIPPPIADDGGVGHRPRTILIVVTVEVEVALLVDRVDDAVSPGEEKVELIPPPKTDDGGVGHLPRAILIVVTVEVEVALLVDRVDDAVSPGEKEFECIPPPGPMMEPLATFPVPF
jgi:chemotaxis signal transduction protein